MLIFLVAVSAIAVMVFVEWQYTRMGQRLRARHKDDRQPRLTRRRRQH